MQFNVQVKIQSDEMESRTVNNAVTADGFDRITVSLPGSTVDKEVDICPGATEGQLKLIHIVTVNGVYPAGISYKIHEDTNPAISLTEPHLYNGKQDMVSTAAFDKLFFSNSGASAVDIDIFVARDVTP